MNRDFQYSSDSEEYFNSETSNPETRLLILGNYIYVRAKITCKTMQTSDGSELYIIYIARDIKYISSTVGDPYSSLTVEYEDVRYTLSCGPAKDMIIKIKN